MKNKYQTCLRGISFKEKRLVVFEVGSFGPRDVVEGIKGFFTEKTEEKKFDEMVIKLQEMNDKLEMNPNEEKKKNLINS